MLNYYGCACDVCKQTFDAESDIVVCPECGTPHHRECYKELGHCVNEINHAENFEWKNPNNVFNSNTADKTQPLIANRCPHCGKENVHDAVFCENCGTRLGQSQNFSGNADGVLGKIKSSFDPNTNPVTDNVQNRKDNFARFVNEVSANEEISDKEMALYIGPSALHYLRLFKMMDVKSKPKLHPFSWSAFFFDGFYFFYRKMWIEALIVVLVSGIISAPSVIMMSYDMGLIGSEVIAAIPYLDTLVIAGSVASAVFKVALGYLAVPLYRKKVVRVLKKLKTNSATPQEYLQRVAKCSGPSKIVLYVTIVLFTAYLFI